MRSVFRLGLAAMIAALAPAVCVAQAPPPTGSKPPLSAYGALPAVELVALSPTGRRLAFVGVSGETRVLSVVDMDDRTVVGRAGIGEVKVRDVQWIDEEQVLVTVSSTEFLPDLGLVKEELFFARVFEPAAERVTPMLARDPDMFPALMGPAEVVGTDGATLLVRAHSFTSGIDLYRVDPQSGRARLAERMGREVDDYLLGVDGRAVARSEYDQRTKVWSLHLREGNGYREVWRTEAPVDLPGLVGLGLEGESVIVVADRPDLDRGGRTPTRFFDVDMKSGEWRPLRFEFDPTGMLFHPATRRLIGVRRVEEDGMRYAFFDDAALVLWDAVEKALPGRAPELVGWSDDLTSAVAFTSGTGDSGSYHFVDLELGAFTDVGAAYPDIEPAHVAQIMPLSYRAADGLEINGYLTLPSGKEPQGLPLVVLAHGGPAARDTAGFDWWGQALAAEGYAVLQANFRGSTGYGQAFMEAGYGEWGRKMQTDLSDGVRHLAGAGVIDPSRVCIVGASYGGYAAMAGPTLDRGVYRCAVAVAGVSDLRRMVDHEAAMGSRRDNDTVRYWSRFMGAERLGDRSLDERSPARLAEQADAPILLIHGRDDTVVPIFQSRAMAEALRRAGKPHELIELAGEDHWLSNTGTRRRVLAETVRFLGEHNPVD
ncbi:alpha/beta hydrolase family protein [Brevundimonas fluminis]|jgi:dipeptidyl aminopeptidase/acylaminoacyl peptidase|uniref:alpha/beta hydrolase family protein n=1 Tax=Brevundimonas fluminis TaxID=2487274 RepID=UPI001F49DE10|nr:prolyl oligopeptidase family serine peptidase [Brevundimonas fluminis]